jgi:hypothetical protein
MMIDRLLDEVLSGRAEAAADALSRQLREKGDPAEEQALRMLLLRSAHIARSRGRTAVADELIRLAMKDASWLVTPGALEACESLDVPVHVTVQEGPAIDAAIAAQLDGLSLPTGPDLETKYRFTALTRLNDALLVTLAPTTWTSASKFHAAIQRNPAVASKLTDGTWITPMPFGDTLLPGIAVVHAIIMTADRRVIAAQRSREMSYSPLHWSVSFEEQLNDKDVGQVEDAFTAAARRGFKEEFGADVPAQDVLPLAAVMQMDLLNLGLVMLLLPSMTAQEIHDSWRCVAKDRWEAEDLRGLRLDSLDAGRTSLGQLHPTSKLRFLALQRWLNTQ